MLSVFLFASQAAQVAAASLDLREFMQYVADAAAIGACGFAWRTNARVTRLETVLMEPELGLVSVVSRLRDRGVSTPADFPGIHPQDVPRHKR